MFHDITFKTISIDTKMANITDLPPEILIIIANELSGLDILRLSVALNRKISWKEPPNLVNCFSNVETLLYTINNDILPRNINVCYYAAVFNRLKILKWSRAKNPKIPRPIPGNKPYPWDPIVYYIADWKFDPKIKEYMNNNNTFYGKCPKPYPMPYLYYYVSARISDIQSIRLIDEVKPSTVDGDDYHLPQNMEEQIVRDEYPKKIRYRSGEKIIKYPVVSHPIKKIKYRQPKVKQIRQCRPRQYNHRNTRKYK